MYVYVNIYIYIEAIEPYFGPHLGAGLEVVLGSMTCKVAAKSGRRQPLNLRPEAAPNWKPRSSVISNPFPLILKPPQPRIRNVAPRYGSLVYGVFIVRGLGGFSIRGREYGYRHPPKCTLPSGP